MLSAIPMCLRTVKGLEKQLVRSIALPVMQKSLHYMPEAAMVRPMEGKIRMLPIVRIVMEAIKRSHVMMIHPRPIVQIFRLYADSVTGTTVKQTSLWNCTR